MPRKRGGNKKVKSSAKKGSGNSAPAAKENAQEQENGAQLGSYFSSLNSIKERLSNAWQIVSPVVTRADVALAVGANLMVPIATGAIARYMLADEDSESEEGVQLRMAIAAVTPVVSMTVREVVNRFLAGRVREEIRTKFIREISNNDALVLRDHSPLASTVKDLPSTPEIVNLESARYSELSVPLTVGMVGNGVEFLNLVYNSYRLAGANAAFATAAMALVASILTVKVSSRDKEAREKGWRLDEEIGRNFRSVEANKAQISALGTQSYEMTKLNEKIEKRMQSRIRVLATDFLSTSTHMLLFFSAPKMLKNLKSFFPEGTTQKEQDEFSVLVVQAMSALGNMIKPLTLNQVEYENSIVRLLLLHKIIDDVAQFRENAPLKINYSSDSDSIELVNFRMAKPSKASHESLMEKVNASLADDSLSTIREANLKLECGKTYQLLGKSGLGKSSLLKACTGSWPYASGTINFPCRQDEVYFITQETFMPTKATFLEMMIYPRGETIEVTEKEKLIGLIRELELGEERVKDLDDTEPKNWSTLSRGEQQRIAIIRMIMQHNEPKIIFMDEATASVDEVRAKKMHQMIKDYLPDATIIYVSHDVSKTDDLNTDKTTPSSATQVSSFADATITIDGETGKLSVTELGAKKTLHEVEIGHSVV